MSRLPQPGADKGTWGSVLNDYLSVEHNADGTLRSAGSLASKADSAHTHTQSDVTNLTADLAAKAPLASPAFTGTPTGISKSHVGLANVDDTSDANKPVSSATQTALNLKLNSSDLDVTTATLIGGTSSTATAINAKVSTAIASSMPPVYVLAPGDPDPTTGSPAGLYFRRMT